MAQLRRRAVADPGGIARRIAIVPAGALRSPSDIVPMAGRWDVADGALSFVPRVPFARGTTYALVQSSIDESGALRWLEVAQLLRPAASVAPTATVVAIHPDVPAVPENLLRFSVTFSAPMEEGRATGRVHLRDSGGDDLEHTLLAMPPELWDMPRRRLTLLLEPGRIKRGLVPNVALGAPLAHSSTVELVVDASMRDATGATLTSDSRRAYRVGPAVRSRVDPGRWSVAWPMPGSDAALVIIFDRPMDHAQALRALIVTDRDGTTLSGSITLDMGEARWSFTPDAPWPADGVDVHVDTTLEDLAGNSVRRVFDRDLRTRADDPLDLAEVVLSSDDLRR